MKNKDLKEEESEFSFVIEDFHEYYNDGDQDSGEKAETHILEKEAPNVRLIRSKFTNGVRMLEIIASLIETASKYSLKIHSDTNEISDFRKHKGSYATIYYHVKPMFGKYVINHVEKLENTYEKIIKIYSDNPTGRNYLLLKKVAKLYESKVHKVMMGAKVSFETERIGSGPIARQRILS